MSILGDLEKIKSRTSVFVLFNVLLLITPGILITYLFFPDMFLSLDWPKLLLLSLTLYTPLPLLNTIFIAVITEEAPPRSDDDFFSLTSSVVVTAVMTYVTAVVTFLTGNSMSLFYSVLMVSSIIMIVFINFDKRKK